MGKMLMAAPDTHASATWFPPQVLWSIILWCAVCISAGGVVYAQHRSRFLFVEQERLRQNQEMLHSEWTQLLLEQNTWAAYGRVDNIASHELRMFLPAGADIRLLSSP